MTRAGYEGLSLTVAGEGYAVEYLPSGLTGNRRGYYYLAHLANPNRVRAVARFYSEDEARRFMAFMQDMGRRGGAST